jgi:hypothetical protein
VKFRKPVIVAGAVAAFAAWYAFRPERAFIDRRVSEPPPAAEAVVLLAGAFEPRAHEGRGTARVVRLASGEIVLSFADFETLNGPDLQVYLLGRPDVSGRADLANTSWISLGALKGNVGPQSYVIPAGTDLAGYSAVSVWCRRFGVNFTTATLTAPAAQTGQPGT